MLIHNYSILQFNSNNAHQVIKIPGIVKKGNTYPLKVWFVEILNSESVHTELTNPKERIKYKNGKKYFREVPISLARYFVLGSLWWNNQKPLLSETSNQTRINANFIKDANVISVDPTQYLNGVILHISDSICYELSKPLYYHSKLKNVSQLSFSAPGWKEKYTVDFIIFPSSEIYRYFFTAFGINSVNEWMMSPNFYSDFKNERALAQQAMGKNEFPVFLNHGSNYRGVSAIGNCLHIEEFKSQLRDFENGLVQKNSTDFDVIKRLPLNEMQCMEVIAKKVTRKTDGKSGLLVHQIKSCLGYTENMYKPFFPIVENAASGGKRNYPGGNDNSITDLEDKLNLNYGGITTNDNSPEVQIDLIDIDTLTDTIEDIKILEAELYKAAQIDVGTFFNPKEPNNNVSLPGQNTEGGGKKLRNKISIDAQDFFEGFPKVVNVIINELNQNGYSTLASYFCQQGFFSTNVSLIETRKLQQVRLKDEWWLYAAEIEVRRSHNQRSYFFYLFEKKLKGAKVSNRLLIYATLEYGRLPISSFLDKIEKFIQEEIEKDKPGKTKTHEICNRLNARQTKGDMLVDFDSSIQSQGIKIAKNIRMALGKGV